MLYNPPSGATNPNASYIGKNVVAGQQGSRVPKNAVEHPQRELVNFISKSGLTPSASDLHQLAKAVQSGQVVYATATGTNALSASLDPAPTDTLQFGMHILVFCPNANTAAVTLSLNGGPNEPVIGRLGGNFAAGDIPAGGSFLLLARRTGQWRCVFPVASEYAASASTIINTYMPQRHGFGWFFSDVNPIVHANVHYDNNTDPASTPPGALVCYDKGYTSWFPSEKTLLTVLMLTNYRTERPGTAAIKCYARPKAIPATGSITVQRNNYDTMESRTNIVAEDWRSFSTSMIVAKPAGISDLNFQLLSFWSEQTANVGTDPYRLFLDTCQMIIIEEVITGALPTYSNAD